MVCKFKQRQKEKNVKNVLQMEPVGIQKSVDELAHPSKVQENESLQNG